MRKFQLLSFLMICFTGTVFATTFGKDSIKRLKRIEIIALDTLSGYKSIYVNPDENLNDLFAQKIDSMLNSWYIQNFYPSGEIEAGLNEHSIVSLPDSVYIERLQSIESFVDLSFNTTVKNFIELYTQRKRSLTEFIVGMSAYYFPMIEEQLDKYNLPMELKYLPIIESAFNPTASSRASAVGMWQFMYGTGKMYNLEIGTFLDERRDPVKSTEAAAKYLRDLYKIYNNWHLVIAAYNCGPGNVNKAIRRSGGTSDYWSIYYKLPRETRGYVPAYIAAAYVMNHYKDHNLIPKYPDFSLATDTIKIHEYLHFSQISEVINVSVEELKALNPQYRMDIIPGRAEKPYALRIPMDKVADFIDWEDEIFAHKREEIFPNNKILVPKTHGSHYTPTSIQGKERIQYTVKSGDNPGFIAEWFHVRLNDLRDWNNIHRNMIRVGQKLTIYVPKDYSHFYSGINNMSFSQKQAHAKIKPVVNTVVSSSATASSSSSSNVEYDAQFVYYTVRNGDTLWSIAQRFPGVSNSDIMRLNNLANANKIKPGQKLKIQTKTN